MLWNSIITSNSKICMYMYLRDCPNCVERGRERGWEREKERERQRETERERSDAPLHSRFSEVDFHYQSSRGVIDLKNLNISVTPRHLDLVYKNPIRQQQQQPTTTRKYDYKKVNINFSLKVYNACTNASAVYWTVHSDNKCTLFP